VKADFDTAWKEGLELFLQPFLQICFPRICKQIDWSRRVEFLDKELQDLLRPAKGRLMVDKLAKARLLNGSKLLVLLHIEVQHHPDKRLPERLFHYNVKLSWKHNMPVATLVILADRSAQWEPTQFLSEILDCRIQFDFPVCKLIKLKENHELFHDPNNPAAFLILADWAARETAKDPAARFKTRFGLTKKLLGSGLSPEDIRRVYGILALTLWLPQEEEKQFEREVRRLESENNMPLVTTYEKSLIKKGLEKGLEKGRKEGLKEGRQEGRQEGREEGIQEGAASTLRRNIMRALEHRLGVSDPAFEQMINQVEEIERLERILELAWTSRTAATFKKRLSEL
jgi:hypothetical protein